MSQQFLSNALFIATISILLFFLVKYKLAEYAKSKARKKRFKRGLKLETEAEGFLIKKGYNIVENQAIYYHNYIVNGHKKQNKLIVDYIAEKEGKTYIIEVKSGKKAISLDDKNSRRQLLEYDVVIENDGVILLDMENKKLQYVQFHSKEEKQDNNFRKVVIVLAMIGILIPFWKVRILIGLILIAIWKYPFQAKKVLKTFFIFKF
jgi:Holliday junction resolvase